MPTAKTLIRLGGSESSLGHMPFCLFCREAAQFFFSVSSQTLYHHGKCIRINCI